MIRRGLRLLLALAFLVSAAAVPGGAADAPKASHACCGGEAPKKSPAGDSHACCRPALPASVRAAFVAPDFVAAVHASTTSAPRLVLSAIAPAPAASVRVGAPVSPGGLSPPRVA